MNGKRKLKKRDAYAAAEKKATNANLTFPTAYNCNIALSKLGVCTCPVTARPNRGKTTVGIVSGLIE